MDNIILNSGYCLEAGLQNGDDGSGIEKYIVGNTSIVICHIFKRSMKIGTHSGTFHADEALAVYMLRLLPKFKESSVVRSRDPKVLEECDIVVDVGGKYEPPKWYDHHQREFTTTFDAEHTITKLSSAGLIYKHYGREVIARILDTAEKAAVIDAIFSRVNSSFIEPVDAMDNGVTPYDTARYNIGSMSLQSLVSNLNPLWVEDGEPDILERQDRQFQKASDLMGSAFEAEVRKQGLSWYPAKEGVEAALAERKSYDPEGRILVFDRYLPWKGHLYELSGTEDILYVLYPSGDSFRVQAVAVAPDSFESRKPLPAEWRGLRDANLSEKTGVDGGVFVHASGFIGGNKTREGALQLAKLALDA